MKEKILAALKTKFAGVEDAVLTRIAEKKANGVTDESQVPAIVEGVGFQDVLTSYGDFRANGAVASAVSNYEKKHGLKDGKPIESQNPDPKPDPNPSGNPDISKIISEAVANAVKPLSEKLTQLETEKIQATRQETILSKAKEYGIPETLVPMLKVTDDADLDTFMKDAKQTFINAGLADVKSPEAGGDTKSESEAIASMINHGTKEIVESKK